MSDLAETRRLALSLPEVTEQPHFDMASFRVRGKTFVTVPPEGTLLHVFVDPLEVEGYVAQDRPRSSPCAGETGSAGCGSTWRPSRRRSWPKSSRRPGAARRPRGSSPPSTDGRMAESLMARWTCPAPCTTRGSPRCWGQGSLRVVHVLILRAAAEVDGQIREWLTEAFLHASDPAAT
jgi:hypothetical protein